MSKEAIANLRSRAEKMRDYGRHVGDTRLMHTAADCLMAVDGWEAALATYQDERGAWDAYASAAMTDEIGSATLEEYAATCGEVADAMLAERRKRFGGGA